MTKTTVSIVVSDATFGRATEPQRAHEVESLPGDALAFALYHFASELLPAAEAIE
jgi:hypothetical protein